MAKYDVIVAGAGPGGASAAYYLAKAGIKTALVDQDTFPRYKPCGGGLCPHCEEFKWIDRKYFGPGSNVATIFSPSLKYEAYYDPGSPIFYEADREQFDNHLYEKALDAGAEFVHANIKGIKKGMVVETDGKPIKGRTVIGATGVYGPIAKYVRKKIGLPQRWDNDQLGSCMLTEFKVGEDFIEEIYSEDRRALMFFLKFIRGGYGWVFPKQDSLNIGVGTHFNTVRAYGAHKAHADFMSILKKKKLLPKKVPKFEVKGGQVPFRGPLKKFVCDNVILIGDAAGFASPMSAEGIYFAIESGRLAAKSLEANLQTDTLSTKDFTGYHKDCMTGFGKDLNILVDAHELMVNNAETSVRIASYDDKLRDMFAELLSFRRPPSKLIGPAKRRMAMMIAKEKMLGKKN